MKAGYSAVTGGAVALTAATAKSILGVKAGSGTGLDLKKISVAFDGVSASAVPVLIEVCRSTFATNSPGTASTSVTPLQTYGRANAVAETAAKTWTTEPTVLTVLREFLLTPAGGVLLYDWPLGDTPDCDLSHGFVIRCNAPATVNVRATIDYEHL